MRPRTRRMRQAVIVRRAPAQRADSPLADGSPNSGRSLADARAHRWSFLMCEEETAMTYSILGHDASNGDLGVAVQSKFPGVGSLVPYGEAEVGVVATQGFGNP